VRHRLLSTVDSTILYALHVLDSHDTWADHCRRSSSADRPAGILTLQAHTRREGQGATGAAPQSRCSQHQRVICCAMLISPRIPVEAHPLYVCQTEEGLETHRRL